MGQNLVPNGNFEIYSQCPYNQGQISFATGWNTSSSTPDYFNSCATYTTGFSIPQNTLGYQKDCAGGNGYAGLFVFTKTSDPNGVREYIHTMLTDTLKQCHKYVASMYVNLSNKCSYAISSMGMYFSDTAIYSSNPVLGTYINIPNPQVKNTTVLEDTLNWIMVRDTFIANGGEIFLTIGNFNPTSQSDTTFLYSNSLSPVSYYYIDSVTAFDLGCSLEGVDEMKNKNVATLGEPQPNPNNGSTQIPYYLPQNTSGAKIIFTDMLGKTMKEQLLQPGYGLMNVDTQDLPAGIYSYTLIVDGKVIDNKKMIRNK